MKNTPSYFRFFMPVTINNFSGFRWCKNNIRIIQDKISQLQKDRKKQTKSTKNLQKVKISFTNKKSYVIIIVG